MPNSSLDVKHLIRRALLDDATVIGLVDDRVRSSHMINPDVEISYPILIIEFLSGFGRYQGTLQTISIDLYAYSEGGLTEAHQVYDAAYNALQAARLYNGTEGNGSRIISAAGSMREIERPDEGYNDRLGAWWVRGKWLATTAG